MQERGKHKASVFTSVVCIVRYKKNLLALVMLTGSKKGITWIRPPQSGAKVLIRVVTSKFSPCKMTLCFELLTI